MSQFEPIRRTLVLRQHTTPLAGLMDLVRAHLLWIAPTMGDAIGQQNNHGTSEAAALFVGGSWLAAQGEDQGKRWAAMGRQWLEGLATGLIEPDGSCSQYSVNYHRVMLDTYAFAETWRCHLNLKAFASALQDRLGAAMNWLYQMTHQSTGGAPNLGANDGARLFPFSDAGYRDFRPSLQWAAAVFLGKRAYQASETTDAALAWLSLDRPIDPLAHPTSHLFDAGGFAILRKGNAMAMLRYPRIRFRPSQCDALHLDIWIDGKAMLRDAGSYSYAAPPRDYGYFLGADGHNGVSFDDKDQMTRLGRFLFGDWLKTRNVPRLLFEREGVQVSAAYKQRSGASHLRNVQLFPRKAIVTDEVSGFHSHAVLRWRLPQGEWKISGQQVMGAQIKISVEASAEISRFEIVAGWESVYYLEKEACQVLEVLLETHATVKTCVEW